eukprot:2097352-Prymnesium_polylepis.1
MQHKHAWRTYVIGVWAHSHAHAFARAPCAHVSSRRSCVRTPPLSAKRRLSARIQGVSAMQRSGQPDEAYWLDGQFP